MKIIDMHCDTIGEIRLKRKQGESIGLRRNSLMVDLEKMKKGGYSLQNFALFVYIGEKGITPYACVTELLHTFKEEMKANQDLITQVYNTEDIRRNEAEGKLSALLTVEEGGALEGSIEHLQELYRQGVRMLTLTWNFENELGYPNLTVPFNPYTPNTEGGLKKRGIEILEEMERLGMIVDVSHLSDAGFWDVVKYSRKPFVASHSNARAVCPWNRNLTDDMIHALAEKGGVTGLNYAADFLRDHPGNTKMDYEHPAYASVEDIAKHARHIVNVGGIECLGLGSDFDGIPPHPELSGADEMPKVIDAFIKNGFHESEIDKILYGNVFRLYRDILG